VHRKKNSNSFFIYKPVVRYFNNFNIDDIKKENQKRIAEFIKSRSNNNANNNRNNRNNRNKIKFKTHKINSQYF
jgi:hypothetical protein